jgi:hypothetical protein
MPCRLDNETGKVVDANGICGARNMDSGEIESSSVTIEDKNAF